MPTTALQPTAHSTIGKRRLNAKVTTRHQADPRWSRALIAADIADLTRYAFVLPDRDYTAAVHDAISSMTRTHGWELITFHNHWADPAFKSITTRWYDPTHNHRIEVELHTQWSWHVRSSRHPLYVCYRDHQPAEPERAELEFTLQQDWQVDDGVPDGATDLVVPPASPPHPPQHMSADDKGYGFYVAVGRYHTHEDPFAVVRRRLGHAHERYDEAFTRGYPWQPTSLLLESDHGDTQFDWIPVDRHHAEQVVTLLATHHNGRHPGPTTQ